MENKKRIEELEIEIEGLKDGLKKVVKYFFIVLGEIGWEKVPHNRKMELLEMKENVNKD